MKLGSQYPEEFLYFANELPDLPETRAVLEKHLKMGACGIGEQKFKVDCDSKAMQRVYSIAQEFEVPVLLHFQHQTYNMGFERFHKMLEKSPGELHRPRARLVGQHRPAPRPGSPLSENSGHPGRHQRPAAFRLPQHVWRPLAIPG